MNLEVGFVDVPALTRAASCAVTPLAQRLTHHGQQLRLPLPDALVADSEPAQEQDLAEIPQCQPVAQPAEHHERDDVARERCSIEDTVATLIELLAAVPTPEPMIALCRQVWPLGHRRRATAYAIHRNQPPPRGILGKQIRWCQPHRTRSRTRPEPSRTNWAPRRRRDVRWVTPSLLFRRRRLAALTDLSQRVRTRPTLESWMRQEIPQPLRHQCDRLCPVRLGHACDNSCHVDFHLPSVSISIFSGD